MIYIIILLYNGLFLIVSIYITSENNIEVFKKLVPLKISRLSFQKSLINIMFSVSFRLRSYNYQRIIHGI